MFVNESFYLESTFNARINISKFSGEHMNTFCKFFPQHNLVPWHKLGGTHKFTNTN